MRSSSSLMRYVEMEKCHITGFFLFSLEIQLIHFTFQWLHDRKLYLDALENQLKDLLKAVDTVVAQRNNLAESANDFALSLRSMASVELSPDLSGPLEGLSDLQVRINELYERQAHQDILTLGITVDEYIRLIGSVKAAFDQRQAAFHAWHTAESELLRHRNMQDKLLRQGRSQQDRLTQAAADVADGERKVHQSRLLFDDLGRILKNELERFEKEKVEDFKSGVETNLESAVEAQKEVCFVRFYFLPGLVLYQLLISSSSPLLITVD